MRISISRMSSSVSHLTNSINATVDVWKLDVSRSHKSYHFALLSVSTCMFLASLQLTWLRKAGKERICTYEHIWVVVLCAAGAGWEVYGYADLSVGRHGWAEAVTTMTQLKDGMSQVSVLCRGIGRRQMQGHIFRICLIDLLSIYQCTFYIFRNDKRCIYQICKSTSSSIGFVVFTLCFRI